MSKKSKIVKEALRKAEAFEAEWKEAVENPPIKPVRGSRMLVGFGYETNQGDHITVHLNPDLIESLIDAYGTVTVTMQSGDKIELRGWTVLEVTKFITANRAQWLKETNGLADA